MEDITEIYRSRISPSLKLALESRANFFGEKNIMNSRIVVCTSLDDLAKHYESVKPCYAFVHAVRFRDPKLAYSELTNDTSSRKFGARSFIIQDRVGTEWSWGRDETSYFGLKIRRSFSDMEILDWIYGSVNFSATFSGPTRHITVLGYSGRITKSQTKKESLKGLSSAYIPSL